MYTPASISQERYLFTESLAFIPPKDNAAQYVAEEVIKAIPLVSIILAALDFMDAYEKRKFTEQNQHKFYIFDVRFSILSLAKHAINAIGLGILILPFRLMATYMREDDLLHKRKCDNPHFLDTHRAHECWMANASRKEGYIGLLKFCPNEFEFCQRMIYRDNYQYPQFIFNSVYGDPLEKPTDAPIKLQLCRNRAAYQLARRIKKLDHNKVTWIS
jgi:hypothetical protein